MTQKQAIQLFEDRKVRTACVIIRFDRPSCSPIAPRKEGAHTLKVG